jgi:membrane-associated PAP2 superfamily phosphatase
VTFAAPASLDLRTGFILKHFCLPLGAGVLLLALDATALDHAASDWFFDAAAGRFPLRYNVLIETVMHQWAKYVVVLIACSVIAAYLFSFAAERWRPWRRLLLFLGLSLVLAPGAVTLLKAVSHKHCPYDLVEYGGYAPYRRLLEAPQPGILPGRCFPDGHASVGFSLFAFYFVGLALRQPGFARAGLWGGLVAGTVFGLSRVAQGAHFLSHDLWAALVCWLVILGLYVVIIGLPNGFRPAVAGAGKRRVPD